MFLGHVGQLIIDLLNELALPVQSFLEIGQTGDVPGKGEHQTNGARLIKDRKARQHQFLSVIELLHTGGGFAGPNDFRVEDVIKNTFLDQGTHVVFDHKKDKVYILEEALYSNRSEADLAASLESIMTELAQPAADEFSPLELSSLNFQIGRAHV